jgi:hypothetical protein
MHVGSATLAALLCRGERSFEWHACCSRFGEGGDMAETDSRIRIVRAEDAPGIQAIYAP